MMIEATFSLFPMIKVVIKKFLINNNIFNNIQQRIFQCESVITSQSAKRIDFSDSDLKKKRISLDTGNVLVK